MTTNYMHF